ncbi:MAG: hypothetical protein HKN11_07510 [Rhizobiales bacterium]|nr:hypothetical protein [Hyphomicrobiales bacterium]
MNWPDEALSSLRGSWRLFMRDTGGFEDFDLSMRGFWRSFAVIIVVAPFYLYAVIIQDGIQLPDQPPHETTSLNLAAAGLVVQWFAWPLVMAIIARFAGLAHNYARYIVVYNWSAVLVMAVQMVPILLLAQGAAMFGLATVVFFIFYAVVLYYRWYIAHTALETTPAIAWALVLGDLVLSIGVTKLIG